MEFISDLNGYVEIDGTASLAADLAGKTYVNAAAPRDDELDVMAEIDGTAGEAATPRNGVVQTAGFEIYIDGILFGRHLQGETISVRRSYDERLQSYDFEVHLTTPTGPLGSPFGCNIPPTRQKRIDVYGVYLTSTGVHRVPLITGGIAHATSRRGTDGGYFETYSGVDRGGRFDQKLVEKVFPPGHGLRRDQVLQKCAEAAGETQFRLEEGRKMLKEFQILDSTFIEPCAELLDIENRRIVWNDRGELTNPQIGRRRSNETVRWQFDERDMAAAEAVSVDFKADVITEVIANGTEQLTAEQCGDVVITTTIEVKDIAAPQPQAYIQESSGYSANAGYPATDYTVPKIVELQVLTRIERCNVEIYQRREVYTFYNPETARYHRDEVNLEWDRVPYPVYVADDEDDDNPAFAFHAPRWGLVSVEELWTFYFQDGYQAAGFNYGAIHVPGGFDRFVSPANAVAGLSWARDENGYPMGMATDPDNGDILGAFNGVEVIPGYIGVKLGTFARKHEMYLVKGAQKRRSPPYTTPFDEIEPGIAGTTYITGDGMGVAGISGVQECDKYFASNCDDNNDLSEQLLVTEEVLESYLTNRDGFMVGKDTLVAGIAAKRGSGPPAYWFGEGYVAAEEWESFRQLTSTSERYEAVGDANHNIYRSGRDTVENKATRQPSEFNVEGYLPAAEYLPEAEIDDTLYSDETERDLTAVATMRTTSRPMDVTVTAEDLENCGHEHSEYKLELLWAEDVDELNFGANAIIDESAAADVNLTLAGANFFVRECDLILAQYRPIDLNDVIRCKSVEWSGGGRSPILTRIQGKLYHG